MVQINIGWEDVASSRQEQREADERVILSQDGVVVLIVIMAKQILSNTHLYMHPSMHIILL